MKKTFTLIKNLKSVSFAAGLVLATTLSNAEVEKTNVNVTKTQTTEGTQYYMLDMNNDGTDDFSIYISKISLSLAGVTSTSTSVSINGIESGNEVGVTVEEEEGYATAYSQGNEISTATWSDEGLLFVKGTGEYGGITFPIEEGNFLSSTGKFLVVKFMIGNDSHLGYIEINTTDNSFTVKSYGYEKTAEAPITVGAGTATSISSYIQSNTTIYNSNNAIIANFTNSFNGKLELVSLNGNVVKSMNISGNSASLSVEELPAGIYQVVLSGAEGYATKKVFIAKNN